jgi:hypothetical protein
MSDFVGEKRELLKMEHLGVGNRGYDMHLQGRRRSHVHRSKKLDIDRSEPKNARSDFPIMLLAES